MTENKEEKFDQDRYLLLMKCAEKKDMTEWNEWYADYQDEMEDKGRDKGAQLEGADLREAYLRWAQLWDAHLEGVDLRGADLEGVDLRWAHLEEARLEKLDLKRVQLGWAHLEGAVLRGAHLEGADLEYAHLEGACLNGAHLEEANLSWAYLEGADLSRTYLGGVSFCGAGMDGKTRFIKCRSDEKTDFTATAIASTQIDQKTLTGLQRNIRRKHWEEWYTQSQADAFYAWISQKMIFKLWKLLTNHFSKKPDTAPVGDVNSGKIDPTGNEGGIHAENRNKRPTKAEYLIKNIVDVPFKLIIVPITKVFWQCSDYGSNTGRVIFKFVELNIFFTLLYVFFAPTEVLKMECQTPLFDIIASLPTSLLSTTLIPFGITDVTIQGLGFFILFLVASHVILGYVLLAALVTRFAIMFQSLGR